MFDYLFSQYADYDIYHVYLEIIAVIFGILSVWFARKNNILVFPIGLVSNIIFIYLLWKWTLLGDMIINGYYVIMGIYGWYHWTRKKDSTVEFPISMTTKTERKWSWIIFFTSMAFVILVYLYFGKLNSITAYVDTLTTGIFFVGMWLMAKRKIENWILWIIGDFISIPLYFYKGYTFTSIQYIIFTIIAFYGYLEWKKILQQKNN